jgi:hypothetical protein
VEQSAVSHQLRLLRTLGLVAGSRQGRRVATAFTTATWLSSSTRPSTTSNISNSG